MIIDFENRIEDLWNIEIEILDELARVCDLLGLKYSLAYGTLIGAVRHKGFIPWDDDVDVMMPRDDYKILLKKWNDYAKEGFILQNKYTEKAFTQNFTKIRCDKTHFIQTEDEFRAKYHTGIFIDIFPYDKVPVEKNAQKKQKIATVFNLLFSRNHHSDRIGAIHLVESILLSLPESFKYTIWKKTDSYISKWNSNNKLSFFNGSTIENIEILYPYNIFDRMCKLRFGDREYSCIADYDKVLRIQYGDYMKLPPEGERILAHKPIIVEDNRGL